MQDEIMGADVIMQTEIRSAAEPIYQALKTGILSGELAPGQPLRQDEIARLHGVSKIPVREALLRLEIDGYVLLRKNRGATVRGLSAPEILNIMDIRVALECLALGLAISQMGPSDLAEARRVLDQYAQATNVARLSALNLEFHQALYAPSDNAELLRMISDLQHRIGPYIQHEMTRATGHVRPQDEHLEILLACEAQDTDRAVSLLRRHIETTKREMAARLRRRGFGAIPLQGDTI